MMEGSKMKRNPILAVALMAIVAIGLLATTACKTSGMAMTSRGQLFKINIEHPTDLPESGEDNLDVMISNRGAKSIKDILVDVELPPQLVVVDQTNERGVNVIHDPGSNRYSFTLSNVQVGETSKLRFRVRTAFGTMSETGKVTVKAWQRELPGDSLTETAVIKLRS
jgi:hypothetical protein